MLPLLTFLPSILKSKVGKVIALTMILVVVITIIFYVGPKSDKHLPPAVVTLLQEVNYMEELEVITFYSQHVMMLGEPGLVEEMALTMARDTVETQKDISKLKEDLGNQQREVTDKESAASSAKEKISPLLQQLEGLEAAYDSLSDRKGEKMAKFLESKTAKTIAESYSKEMSIGWREVSPFYQEWETASKDGNGKSEFSAYKRRKKKFQQIVKPVLSSLKEKIKTTSRQLADQKKNLNINKLAKREKIAVDRLQRIQDQLEFAKDRLLEQRKWAIEMRDSAANAISQGSRPDKVKIITIVPASIGAYIDMSAVSFSVEEPGNQVRVNIDSILLAPAIISIDSSKVYELNGNGLTLKRRAGGLYHELFLQIRLWVRSIEKDAVAKAYNNGIIEESCFAVEEYFKNMFKTLGYRIFLEFNSDQCECLSRKTPPLLDSKEN